MTDMTPDRWKHVEALYHAALARPARERAALLAEACPDDEALRREVESLLRESGSDDEFLGGAAQIMALPTEVVVAHADWTGRTIGSYHLQKLLGVGGMGEVYRARDAKLGRDVAMKVLPRAVTRDPDRLARFEREARMLAALNHPNICAIYGLEEADGIRFLVLELVDGVTLARTLEAGASGLAIPDAVAIARQIAEAPCRR
jgi:serine/threonine protein kinase